MTKIRVVILIFFLLLCYRCHDHAIEIEPEIKVQNPPAVSIFIDDFSSAIERVLVPYSPGMAVCVVKDGQLIFSKGFGVKDIRTNDPVEPTTLFRIGSLSKAFAAALVGILAEEGSLRWEDPIKGYLEDFDISNTDLAEDITLEHLASHTGGFAYHTFTNLIEDGLDMDQLTKAFKKARLVAYPGQLYSYQNAAFSLIQPVVENVTGVSFQDLLKAKIFEPLNMCSASAEFRDIVEARDVATPHRFRRGSWLPTNIREAYYNAVPAGGVHASSSDMANWMLGLMSDSENFSHVVQRITEPVVETHIERRYFSEWSGVESSYYGLGWRIVLSEGRKIIYHGGLVNDFRSEIAFIPEEKIGVCFLFNSASHASKKGVPLFLEFSEILRKKKPNPFDIIRLGPGG